MGSVNKYYFKDVIILKELYCTNFWISKNYHLSEYYFRRDVVVFENT